MCRSLLVLKVSEKGMGVPAIVGDAIGRRVRRRWQVPIKMDSDLVLLRTRPLWQNQLCKADRQSESSNCRACISVLESCQCVWVGQALSLSTLCHTSVPQGSVLGPILFLCYISPISFIANTFGVGIQQYADDTQLFASLLISKFLAKHNKLETLGQCILHTSAKARLTSVVIRIRDLDSHQNLIISFVHLPIANFPWKFHTNPFRSFCANLLTDRQTDRQTNNDDYIHILLGGGKYIRPHHKRVTLSCEILMSEKNRNKPKACIMIHDTPQRNTAT